MTSTVCVTDTSMIPFPSVESTYTQTSNTAGRPLPHIPRRNSRTGYVHSLSETALSGILEPTSSFSAYALADPPSPRPEAHVRYDSTSSSSSSTPSDEIRPTIIPRSKRVPAPRTISPDSPDVFTPVAPTPIKPRADTCARSFADLKSKWQTPLRDSSDDEMPRPMRFGQVGKIRLEGVTGKHTRQSSDPKPNTSAVLVSTTVQPSGSSDDRPIRKRSGEPVKSSLKSARRPVLSVVTGGTCAKSEPSTPTHTKAVHFDSKLEHVKLFLAEQKPLAVSRDGSPTSDTSGTDEFPAFIYGNGREAQDVKMLVPNMPSIPRTDVDVALQQLFLSHEQRIIVGKIRVRNIAYEKWLAVRFTLDWWQTTSEVTARYEESVENGAFDIFTFSIRLQDIWARIEEKTIFMAVRYTTAGTEYWDNNAGQNYHVKFVPASPSSEPSSTADDEAAMSDLKSRLEEVAKARSAAPHRPQRSFSAGAEPLSLTSGKSLSSRYDFATAYKMPWVGPPTPPAARHVRTYTYPATPGPNAAPWSNVRTAEQQVTSHVKPFASPPKIGSMQDTPSRKPETMVEIPSPSRIQDGRGRNHRRSYFERTMDESPNIKRTPQGSPLKFSDSNITAGQASPVPQRRLTDNSASHVGKGGSPPASKPPLSIQTARVLRGASQESAPPVSSESSSSSTPSLSPDSGSDAQTPMGLTNSDPPQGDLYKQFLNQFCFYTGSDSLLDTSDILPRSHSASSVEQFLLSQPPSPHGFISHIRDAATLSSSARSSSFDEITHRSGSVTPTGRQLLFSESRPATPVAG
ncbi:putative phosphatase regulatory subunit-domain-containing protein [Phlebopus sp. FC_14]|nr:putative phosphatase regulatory subunit-domain-containing protein [Phlebopus sp. FC_14]